MTEIMSCPRRRSGYLAHTSNNFSITNFFSSYVSARLGIFSIKKHPLPQWEPTDHNHNGVRITLHSDSTYRHHQCNPNPRAAQNNSDAYRWEVEVMPEHLQ